MTFAKKQRNRECSWSKACRKLILSQDDDSEAAAVGGLFSFVGLRLPTLAFVMQTSAGYQIAHRRFHGQRWQ